MKIYTKFGDKGFTSLFSGKKVKKHDYRVEAYGNVDELNSYIGLVRDLYNDSEIKNDLINIQKKLFILGSELASPKEVQLKSIIFEEDIFFLEKRIDDVSEKLPIMTHFILQGGHIIVSHCHIARTICRRVERRISYLSEKRLLKNNNDLIFINRLSDYLFVIARKYSNDNNIEEIKWIP